MGAALAAMTAGTARAESDGFRPDRTALVTDSTTAELPYLQCVPYARRVSGIGLYGDAHTWWDQAAGRFERGRRPMAGAVMSFRPHGAMTLGHVAAVSKVIDSRTVLLRHANWSPIGGRRGQIEDDVRAVDVSPGNDWSAVRVWYAPIGALGTTHWPVDGFIYNEAVRQAKQVVPASATGAPGKDTQRALPDAPARPSRIGKDFLAGIVPEAKGRTAPTPAVTAPAASPRRTQLAAAAAPRPAPAVTGASLRHDPIGRIIASRMP